MNNNELVQELFYQLNTQHISYCVLRNYESLPHNTGGSDIDMWIDAKDEGRFLSILSSLNQCDNFTLVSYIEDDFCPKVCYQTMTGGMQIDIFKGGIYYQNNVMIPGSVLCKHLKSFNGVVVLDDSLANLVAALKEILNNGRCEDKYLKPLYKNKTIYSAAYLKENLPQFNELFIEALFDALQNETIHLQVSTLCRIGRRNIKRNPLWCYKIKKIKRWFSPPGYVIAVLGTDGSGKSTIIDAITPWLNEGFHNSVVYNHLRPNVFPDLGVLLGKKEKSEKPIVVSDPHAEKPSGLMGSLVRWGYYMLDYTIGYLKSVYPVVHTKSKVFIFDRYYYDYYVDQKRSRTSLPQWILRLGELFVPNPDLILCLGGDPKKIYERKPETSLEEVTLQTEKLHKFCEKRKNAAWVDTTLPLDETLENAKTSIVEMLTPRFKNVKL